MNSFLNQMVINDNIKYTENGGITRKTTYSKVLDMFAFGGAYRRRSNEDIILLFKNAFEENKELALKCLFYLRDVRGGQGERKFFRIAFGWLCRHYPKIAEINLKNVSEYGRWDDLIYSTFGTPVEQSALNIIKNQLALDIQCKTPSLLAKWLPSQNASSEKTKRYGKIIANYLKMTSRQYRKTLSILRSRINVLERLMSENRWDEIEFDKIPSKAGFIYKNAFARRDIIARKYKTFVENKNTKVNAEVLYPHEIAHKAFSSSWFAIDSPERQAIQKYWDNLKDFYNGREENAIAIVDTSGSMYGLPLEAAVSLGAYIADKSHGPFANHFITFSEKPALVAFKGLDIVDKFKRCSSAKWGMNTNLKAVFDLLLNTAKSKNVNPKDIPERLYIFSDMEFDSAFYRWDFGRVNLSPEEKINSDIEKIKIEWEAAGYKMPSIIFWNLNARHNNVPAIGEGFSYVSGFSPVMIDTILGGKDGYDLMLEKLLSERYNLIKVS